MELSKDEIIRMARGAGFETKVFNSIDGDEVIVRHSNGSWICISDELERFFNLAFAAGAAHEREKIPKDFVKACEVLVQEKIDAVLAEREACAKVCEEQDEAYYPIKASGIECATAIRARTT